MTRLLILPGDGIGPEIVAATETVLAVLDGRFDLGLRIERKDIGFAALESLGSTLPDGVVAAANSADGIILGPVSHANYPPLEKGGINPSGALRKQLDLYANIRPSRSWPGVTCMGRDMDLVMVRENTEGFYADRNMEKGGGEFMPTPDLALSLRKVSRAGSARIARTAANLAMARRRQVAVVHKANVLKMSDGLFCEAALAELAAFPEIKVEEILVDAMASLLVREPRRFDVIVTTNMFGDILSNEAAEIAGGLGLAGSLNLGDGHAMAQASHGSAPDLAGTGLANPTSLLLSTAMLLDWRGSRDGHEALTRAADALQTAIGQTLSDRACLTPDLGGTAKTDDFADAVCESLRAST